jgi:hypothetical protein
MICTKNLSVIIHHVRQLKKSLHHSYHFTIIIHHHVCQLFKRFTSFLPFYNISNAISQTELVFDLHNSCNVNTESKCITRKSATSCEYDRGVLISHGWYTDWVAGGKLAHCEEEPSLVEGSG